MSAELERAVRDLGGLVRSLEQSVSTAVHVCHQAQTFEQINTRLGNIETDVKSLLKSSGSSSTIEKVVMLAIAAFIAAVVSFIFRPQPQPAAPAPTSHTEKAAEPTAAAGGLSSLSSKFSSALSAVPREPGGLQ